MLLFMLNNQLKIRLFLEYKLSIPIRIKHMTLCMVRLFPSKKLVSALTKLRAFPVLTNSAPNTLKSPSHPDLKLFIRIEIFPLCGLNPAWHKFLFCMHESMDCTFRSDS